MFDNKVLRRIFGPKRDEVTGELRRLHDEEHYDLYSSPNIIRMIKIGRMGLVGHVEGIGRQERCKQHFGGGNLRERGHLKDIRVDRRIILKLIFKKWRGGLGLAQDMDRWQAVVNAGDELLGSISFFISCRPFNF